MIEYGGRRTLHEEVEEGQLDAPTPNLIGTPLPKRCTGSTKLSVCFVCEPSVLVFWCGGTTCCLSTNCIHCECPILLH